MLEHRAPLEQAARAPSEARSPKARVAAVEDRGLLLLQVDPGDPLLAGAVRELVGAGLPQPLQAAIGGEYALLWMTPREFLLELPAARTSTMQGALLARFGQALAAVTDVSDAFAGFEIGGHAAADALMTGCTLDLRPHVFTPGRVARTAFAGVPTIIWKSTDPGRFRCLVDRSFAVHFRDWFARRP